MIDEKAFAAIAGKIPANGQNGRTPHTLDLPSEPLLIQHQVQGAVIAQRPADGYINATAMCKMAGKSFGHYSTNKATKEYLAALSAGIGIPIPALIHTVMGGNAPERQGTWVHPQVATHLAMWLSPEFAVMVNKWVFEWISGNISGKMPFHLRRYAANLSRIPNGYFSMLNEMIYSLVAPLEQRGYVLPDKLMPDISTGKMFSTFLRRQDINVDAFPKYLHEFSDESGRPNVYARLYPNGYLGDFRDFFTREWLPRQAVAYFQKKDNKALPFIRALLLPAPDPKKRLK